MTSLAALQAQRDALDATIEEMTNAQRKDAIAKAKAIMEAHGLTVADLRTAAGARESKRPPTTPS